MKSLLNKKITILVLILCNLAVLASAQNKNELYQPKKDKEIIPGQPYERYFTKDKFGREIIFYLSETRDEKTLLPLIVYIQGSGCTSLFTRQGEKIFPTSGHATIQQVADGKARVLIIEKPGVNFLDQPQNCLQNSEFNREHTLERWAEAVEAAIRATQTLPQIKKDILLVIGHSEGGVVAARVARDLPNVVTHAAILAGEGASQLFSLINLARKGNFFRRVSENPEERVKYVVDKWREIQAEPKRADKFFFGFAHRRWSSFLSTSPLEELIPVNAKIYLAQGLEDDAVDPVTMDVLYAQLLAQGKSVIYDRIEGADHSFNLKSKPETNGWQKQHQKILDWFIQDK